MTKSAAVVLALAIPPLPLIAASETAAQGCGELWYQRNRIYKSAGYCFRTARAIRAFGNAGCGYDSEEDVPLSARQRRRVAELKAAEDDLGCPR